MRNNEDLGTILISPRILRSASKDKDKCPAFKIVKKRKSQFKVEGNEFSNSSDEDSSMREDDSPGSHNGPNFDNNMDMDDDTNLR